MTNLEQWKEYLKKYISEDSSHKIIFPSLIEEMRNYNPYITKQTKMIKEIKDLRVQIDGLSQLVKELHKSNNPNKNAGWIMYTTKEVEKCYDSLILAKAWLGKVLGDLGEPTPYQNDGNRKTVEDIEPIADKSPNFDNLVAADGLPVSISGFNQWNKKSHIEKVDWLREEIQSLINNLVILLQEELKVKFFYDTCYQYLEEARFWLGFELQRIKENTK